MLILTRRVDEKIVIGENIFITVLAVDGEKVKIGIDAPRELAVLRQELWQAIQEQKQIAEKLAAGEEPAGFDSLRELLASESKDAEKGEDPPEEKPA